MNENDKARKYDTLMGEYMRIENKMMSVPQLSLDEQMKQVDATNKVLYSQDNQKLVNQYKTKMSQIQMEVHKSRLIQ